MSPVRQTPMQRRQFVSPLLTEETTSVDDHRCRVCDMAIPSGTPCLFRAWHVEYSHVDCGWIRKHETEPHECRRPGTFATYWEWQCPVCKRDACSPRQPDAETERRCARCAPDQYEISVHARVEIVLGIRVPRGKKSVIVPARSRARVLEIKTGSGIIGACAFLEWTSVRAPRCYVEIAKLVRV